MNTSAIPSILGRLFFRLRLWTRYLSWNKSSRYFDQDSSESIQRIYVINLDRQGARFDRMKRELNRLQDRSGAPLMRMTRRFSAVDARFLSSVHDPQNLHPYYSLAEQLYVDPHPSIEASLLRMDHEIKMTRQEMAVALSHIAVWKKIAESELRYCLILEDDVYFRRGFPNELDRSWEDALGRNQREVAFDLFYVSFKEVRNGADWSPISDRLATPIRGLWYCSGYVLSARGARRLLELLPVRGPVDLWINHQFSQLHVISTRTSLIEQRSDSASGNSYSILPILSKLGILDSERPLVFKVRRLKRPLFAFGNPGSGLSGLGMALSMLGYRCCQNLADLPYAEHVKLFQGQKGRIFDAYVGITSFQAEHYLKLADLYPTALFIVTTLRSNAKSADDALALSSQTFRSDRHGAESVCYGEVWRQLKEHATSRVLILNSADKDKWNTLCQFLECEYPTDLYPESDDQPAQPLGSCAKGSQNGNHLELLASDTSPWIIQRTSWPGIRVGNDTNVASQPILIERFCARNRERWIARDDTFPGNLSVFRPENVEVKDTEIVRLNLRHQDMQVREYSGASVSSEGSFRYGRVATELKSAFASGLVTGFFLHRNSPRQEIDFEFLGKDTRKALLNVYYNPGQVGARMEYGYRGTPVLADLGFDASLDFHRYEIDWDDHCIRWLVDGRCIHERVLWNPTPIPHLPMQLHVNLWCSRSEELAGPLDMTRLPAHADLRYIEIHARTGSSRGPAGHAAALINKDS
jgi:GR25 family glycosyltransferase involved in LPS biosynthesis